MAYTIIELLDKLILIEKNGYDMFINIAVNERLKDKIKMIARIFANEEKRHGEMYKKLKEEISHENNIEIGFEIYDKASKLAFQFLNNDRTANLENEKDILEFSLNFEKENLALILSIQGLLVREQRDANTEKYRVLDKIISEEQKHIRNIEDFLY
ncbi:hypothetical protein [Wukongibacter sp. M2B1]|uniref:hypothetical protein n=1 Tax=Wukongibacter sp. M2B1 TaxID=3088895 RepID=UPI003D78C23D